MENVRHQSIFIPASRSGNLLSKNVQNELFIPTFDGDMSVFVIVVKKKRLGLNCGFFNKIFADFDIFRHPVYLQDE